MQRHPELRPLRGHALDAAKEAGDGHRSLVWHQLGQDRPLVDRLLRVDLGSTNAITVEMKSRPAGKLDQPTGPFKWPPSLVSVRRRDAFSGMLRHTDQASLTDEVWQPGQLAVDQLRRSRQRLAWPTTRGHLVTEHCSQQRSRQSRQWTQTKPTC